MKPKLFAGLTIASADTSKMSPHEISTFATPVSSRRHASTSASFLSRRCSRIMPPDRKDSPAERIHSVDHRATRCSARHGEHSGDGADADEVRAETATVIEG